MNPRNYDVDELHGIAEGSLSDDPDGPDAGRERSPARADDVVRSNQYRELVRLESSVGEMEKPYLDALPDSYAAELTIFEWLEFLTERGGFKRTLDALRYYRSIGWIDEAVEDRLRGYLRSFDGDGGSGFDRSDHEMSLVYVARLASMTD